MNSYDLRRCLEELQTGHRREYGGVQHLSLGRCCWCWFVLVDYIHALIVLVIAVGAVPCAHPYPVTLAGERRWLFMNRSVEHDDHPEKKVTHVIV